MVLTKHINQARLNKYRLLTAYSNLDERCTLATVKVTS